MAAPGLRRPARPPEASGPSSALKIVASVLANVTLLTALLFYFGFLYTQKFFAYFGVHYTILGQSLDEILARGVDGMLVPFAGVAATVLVVTCVVRYLKARLRPRTWLSLLRKGMPVAAVLGFGLVGLAVVVMRDPASFWFYPGVPGLGLAAGVLLVFFAWRQFISDRAGATAFAIVEWGITFLLVTIALFWSVSDYSAGVGVRSAGEKEAQLPYLPNAVLYSAKSLNLTAEGVHRVVCADAEAAYRYRYDGLKILLQSGGQYVFVPAGWQAGSGTAFVIPRTDSLRLEFTGASIPPAGTC